MSWPNRPNEAAGCSEKTAAKAWHYDFVLEQDIANRDADGVLAGEKRGCDLLADPAEPDDWHVEGPQ